MTDDRELVRRAQAGDADAMNELLGRHYDRVHAVCRRIAGAQRDADDAAQEAMIRVVRHLDRFDGRSKFSTWIYRIATNTALDELRRRSRRPDLVRADPDGDERRSRSEVADPLAHRSVEAVADRDAIDTALAVLPEEYRAAVVLRDIHDLDYAEIAEVLDVAVGTVKSRIARGRRLLVEQLGNQDRGAERPTATPTPSPPPPTPPPDALPHDDP